MTAPEGWVWLARIKRTQGRKGEVFAEILTDFPEKFAQRRRLWLLHENISAPKMPVSRGDMSAHSLPREVELSHHWLHKGGVVLHFAGVDSISAAEELAGLVVAIPREERMPLSADEVYIGDLIGCVLVDVTHDERRVIGEIEDVDRTAGHVAMLVVKSPDQSSEEILIPFAKEYLRCVDVEAKRVEMALPEGLVDINRS
jgi:16S rRNA processing protein RimM